MKGLEQYGDNYYTNVFYNRIVNYFNNWKREKRKMIIRYLEIIILHTVLIIGFGIIFGTIYLIFFKIIPKIMEVLEDVFSHKHDKNIS